MFPTNEQPVDSGDSLSGPSIGTFTYGCANALYRCNYTAHALTAWLAASPSLLCPVRPREIQLDEVKRNSREFRESKIVLVCIARDNRTLKAGEREEPRPANKRDGELYRRCVLVALSSWLCRPDCRPGCDRISPSYRHLHALSSTMRGTLVDRRSTIYRTTVHRGWNYNWLSHLTHRRWFTRAGNWTPPRRVTSWVDNGNREIYDERKHSLAYRSAARANEIAQKIAARRLKWHRGSWEKINRWVEIRESGAKRTRLLRPRWDFVLFSFFFNIPIYPAFLWIRE